MNDSNDNDFLRGFECHYNIMVKNQLFATTNTSCWAGLTNCSFLFQDGKIYKNYEDTFKHKYIYIENYYHDLTLQYIPLLLSIINEITLCKEIKIKNVSYIKFELMETYDQSLILLNFIRYLWNSPLQGYSLKFFEELSKADNPDPLAKLTSAGRNAVANYKLRVYGSPGHSNIHCGLKIKKASELKLFKGTNTKIFLTDRK